MNLENLKKTAIEKSAQALKKFIDSSSDTETDENTGSEKDIQDKEYVDQATDDEFDEFLDAMADATDDETGKTQRFNIQDVLNKVRRKSEDLYQSSKEFISNSAAETNQEENDKEYRQVDTVISSTDTADIDSTLNAADETLNEARQLSAELKSSIGEFQTAVNDSIKKIEETVIALSYNNHDIEGLKSDLEKHINSNASSTATINGKMSAIEGKLNEISNSLSGISKLNDSIFDLKNSQMNSKNSLEELTTAFITLKKKCVAGVTILSIVSVLILIMEVINLLS